MEHKERTGQEEGAYLFTHILLFVVRLVKYSSTKQFLKTISIPGNVKVPVSRLCLRGSTHIENLVDFRSSSQSCWVFSV